MDLLFASEYLLPASGGAERFVLEAAAGLAARGHRVRVLSLGGADDGAAPDIEVLVRPDPAPTAPRWQRRRGWRQAMELELAAELERRPAQVVLGQLHTGPAAVRAAHAAGARAALLLPSHEPFCAWAFAPDSTCVPESGCRDCPRFQAQPPDERELHLEARREQERALATADLLIAPSRSLAATCEAWCGRRASVIAPLVVGRALIDPTQVTGPTAEAPRAPQGGPPLLPGPAPGGPVVLAASQWTDGKGAALLAPLAAALAPRRVRVQWTARAPEPAILAQLERLENVALLQPPLPLDQLLHDAGVLLVPSQAPEAFGRLAVEGMAAGVPVLASGSGGLHETVPPTQLVRPHDDPDAWARAVRHLDDHAHWHAARAGGLAAAAAVLAADPLDALEQVLGAAEPGHGSRPSSANGNGHATPGIVWMIPHAYHPSGLADEARAALRALEQAGLEPAARNVDELGDPALVSPADRELLRSAFGRTPATPALAIHHYRPLPHRRDEPGTVNVARLEWETDTLPPAWREWLLAKDEVWVTCQRNADAFAGGGVPEERLRLLGQTLDFRAFRPGLEPWPVRKPPGRMLFLSAFDFSERKGWRQLLLAWSRAFEPHDPVALLLKTGSVRELRDAEVHDRIASFLRHELGDVPHAPVQVLSQMLPATAMPRIYAAADAYVSASRGEAWGRTWMEALACGLPAIGTSFGGNAEWMADLPGVRLVGGELVPVRADDEVLNPLYRGQRWGEADVDELAAALQAVANDPAGERERASGARRLLIERHGHARFAHDLSELARAAVAQAQPI
jgi:glycosyltransferase involved in cell wall biosynthesis